jgi:purine-cytosine permease-like protein
VILGTFPILFGLSFWQGFLATLVGVVLGGLILMPMPVFGPLNGTNNAVSSGAHFGVVGRVVGSFLSLLTAITFFAISVWTSGDILVGGLDRGLGTGGGNALRTVAYAFFAVAVLVICIYGFRFMLAVNKVAVVAATLLILLGVVAFGSEFDPGYPGTLGDDAAVLPAFVGATLIVIANPLSFGAFLGDWARYIPADVRPSRVMAAAFLSQFATLVPFMFGLATTAVIFEHAPRFVDPAALGYAGFPDYVGGLLPVSPAWFVLPVCVLAIIGGALYGHDLALRD